MKYVGDAIKDYSLASGITGRSNVVAIGFASWGVIDQREKLISDKVRCTVIVHTLKRQADHSIYELNQRSHGDPLRFG